MEKFILANGCALKISDTVRGENVIVLIHGYLQSGDIFEAVTKKLKENFRIITFDVPGHGISEVMGDCHSMEFLADVTHDILRQLEVEKCIIAGHSMGGYIAAKYAEKYGCEGLVMIHSMFGKDTEEARTSRQKEIELILGGKKELLVKMNPQKAIAEKHRNKYSELISDLREQAIMTDDEGIIALLNGMMGRDDLSDFAKKSEIPMLSFWGMYDEFIPFEKVDEFVKEYPKVESVVMENSGHICFIEEKDKFIETMNQFCAKVYGQKII